MRNKGSGPCILHTQANQLVLGQRIRFLDIQLVIFEFTSFVRAKKTCLTYEKKVSLIYACTLLLL